MIISYLSQDASFSTHAPCHGQPSLPPLAQGVHLVINPSASGSWTIHSDGQLLSPKEKNRHKNTITQMCQIYQENSFTLKIKYS
jgi:hypothetical protein